MPNCQQELPNRHKIHVDGELLERGLRTSHVIRRLLLADHGRENENAGSGCVELRSTEQLVMNQGLVVLSRFYSIVERI
jgi:hypothetical protein